MEQTIKWVKGDKPKVEGAHIVIYTTIENGRLVKAIDLIHTRCTNSGLRNTEKGLEPVPESERVYEFGHHPHMVIEYHAKIEIPNIA